MLLDHTGYRRPSQAMLDDSYLTSHILKYSMINQKWIFNMDLFVKNLPKLKAARYSHYLLSPTTCIILVNPMHMTNLLTLYTNPHFIHTSTLPCTRARRCHLSDTFVLICGITLYTVCNSTAIIGVLALNQNGFHVVKRNRSHTDADNLPPSQMLT